MICNECKKSIKEIKLFQYKKDKGLCAACIYTLMSANKLPSVFKMIEVIENVTNN